MERDYEALFIFKAVEGGDLAKAKAALGETLKGLEAKVKGEEDWGRRPMAYAVSGQKEGYYLFNKIALAGEKVAELRRKMAQNDALLRFLILNGD